MKNLLLVLFLMLSSLSFAEEVIVYSHDVATGKTTIDKSQEAYTNSLKGVLEKVNRYKELKAKENLTGAEVEEMMELKDYIVTTYQQMKAAEAEKMKRETALAEQDVLSRMTSQPIEIE